MYPDFETVFQGAISNLAQQLACQLKYLHPLSMPDSCPRNSASYSASCECISWEDEDDGSNVRVVARGQIRTEFQAPGFGLTKKLAVMDI